VARAVALAVARTPTPVAPPIAIWAVAVDAAAAAAILHRRRRAALTDELHAPSCLPSRARRRRLSLHPLRDLDYRRRRGRRRRDPPSSPSGGLNS